MLKMLIKTRGGNKPKDVELTINAENVTTDELKDKLEGFEKLTGKEPVMFVHGTLEEANVREGEWNLDSGRKVSKVGTKYIGIDIGFREPGDKGYLKKKLRHFDPSPLFGGGYYTVRAKTKVEKPTEY